MVALVSVPWLCWPPRTHRRKDASAACRTPRRPARPTRPRCPGCLMWHLAQSSAAPRRSRDIHRLPGEAGRIASPPPARCNARAGRGSCSRCSPGLRSGSRPAPTPNPASTLSHLTDTLLTAMVPVEPSSLTTFTVNCRGLGAGFASTSQSKVSSMAAPSARALTTSGYNPHLIENSPLTEADRPPGVGGRQRHRDHLRIRQGRGEGLPAVSVGYQEPDPGDVRPGIGALGRLGIALTAGRDIEEQLRPVPSGPE